jgi:Na+/melibiose symporter-like transporter
VGLILAGPIVDLLGPAWLFWLPLVVLVVAATAAYFVVPESPSRSAGRINWPAALLLCGWLVALLLPVSRAPQWGWGSPLVLGLLAVAVVLAVLWVVVESRARYPLVDMRMMRRRAVWATNLVALLFGVSMYAAFAFLPQFLQTPPDTGYGFGASVTESGLMLLPQTVTAFVLGLYAGRLGQRFGSKNVLIAGTLVSAASYLFFAAVPPEQTGVASGMNANIRTIGGSVGSALMASVVTAHLGPSGLPQEAGYVNGFLLLTVTLGLAALAAVLIPAVRRDAVTNEEPGVPLAHPEAALVAGGTLFGDDPE